MTRAKHRPPPLLSGYRWHIAAADGALALAAVIAAAVTAAPHAHAPVTVAAPTAVDLREPTGHGGPIGSVTGADRWADDGGPEPVRGPDTRPAAAVLIDHAFDEAETGPIPVVRDSADEALAHFTFAEGYRR